MFQTADDYTAPQQRYETAFGTMAVYFHSDTDASVQPLVWPLVKDTPTEAPRPGARGLARLARSLQPPEQIPAPVLHYSLTSSDEGVSVSLREVIHRDEATQDMIDLGQQLVERLFAETPDCLRRARWARRGKEIQSLQSDLQQRYWRPPEESYDVKAALKLAWPKVQRLPEPWRTLLWEHRFSGAEANNAPAPLGPLLTSGAPKNAVEERVLDAFPHLHFAALSLKTYVWGRDRRVSRLEELLAEERRDGVPSELPEEEYGAAPAL